MRRSCLVLLVLGMTGLVLAQPGLADTHIDEAQLMRKAYARFQALSWDRQLQLRQLDREFQELSEEKQNHYIKVLERYQAWLAQLPEADRKQVVEASTPEDRLSRIKRLRERDWVATLPKVYRDEFGRTTKRVDQLALLEKWREEERTRLREWDTARDHWDDIHQESPPDISKNQAFQTQLDVFLGNLATQVPTTFQANIYRLRDTPSTERYWVWYRSVLGFADKFPLLPTPADWKCANSIDTLPELLKEQVKLKKHHKEIEKLPQYWPAFAKGVTEYAHIHKLKMGEPLGPCRKPQMPKEVQPAINELLQAMDKLSKATEKDVSELARSHILRLEKATGKWPDYPQTIMDLARHYKIAVPGWTLPHPPSSPTLWENIRRPSLRKDKT